MLHNSQALGPHLMHVCSFLPFSNFSQFNRSRLWPALQEVDAAAGGSNSALILATAFELLNAPHSPWLPLICNFPSTYPGMPLTWSDGRLDAAAHAAGLGPELRELVDASVDMWSTFLFNEAAYVNFRFQHIVPRGLPAKFVLWAAFAVLSRGFEQHGGSALIPVADLLNHDHDFHVAPRMLVSRQEVALPLMYEFSMLRDVKAGDQIFNSYGSHCARKWLIEYGFVPREVEAQCK